MKHKTPTPRIVLLEALHGPNPCHQSVLVTLESHSYFVSPVALYPKSAWRIVRPR